MILNEGMFVCAILLAFFSTVVCIMVDNDLKSWIFYFIIMFFVFISTMGITAKYFTK